MKSYKRALPSKVCGVKPPRINMRRSVRAELDAALIQWEIRNGFIPQKSLWNKKKWGGEPCCS